MKTCRPLYQDNVVSLNFKHKNNKEISPSDDLIGALLSEFDQSNALSLAESYEGHILKTEIKTSFSPPKNEIEAMNLVKTLLDGVRQRKNKLKFYIGEIEQMN